MSTMASELLLLCLLLRKRLWRQRSKHGFKHAALLRIGCDRLV